jgi:hypothetical protein
MSNENLEDLNLFVLDKMDISIPEDIKTKLCAMSINQICVFRAKVRQLDFFCTKILKERK